MGVAFEEQVSGSNRPFPQSGTSNHLTGRADEKPRWTREAACRNLGRSKRKTTHVYGTSGTTWDADGWTIHTTRFPTRPPAADPHAEAPGERTLRRRWALPVRSSRQERAAQGRQSRRLPKRRAEEARGPSRGSAGSSRSSPLGYPSRVTRARSDKKPESTSPLLQVRALPFRVSIPEASEPGSAFRVCPKRAVPVFGRTLRTFQQRT